VKQVEAAKLQTTTLWPWQLFTLEEL